MKLLIAVLLATGPLLIAAPALGVEEDTPILTAPDPEAISEPAPEIVEEEPIVIDGGSVDEEPTSSEPEPEPSQETTPTPTDESPTEAPAEEESDSSSEVQEPQPEEPTEQSGPETEQQTSESEPVLEESPSEPPTVIETPGGDDMSYEVPLSAPVLFCGVEYDSIYATTNAVITFGSPDGTFWDYPQTPSISLGSQDWVAYSQRADEHFVISHTDNFFQIDMSARPFGSDPSITDVSRLILGGQILEDRNIEFAYYLENTEQYENLRFGVRTPEGDIQTLEEFGMQQSTAAPEQPGEILTPEPEPEPLPEATPETPEEEPTSSPSPEEEETQEPPVVEEPVSPTPSPEPSFPIYVPSPEPSPEPSVEEETDEGLEEPEEVPNEEAESEPVEESTEEITTEETQTEETITSPAPSESPSPEEEPQPSQPSESEPSNPEAEEPAESLEPEPEPEPSTVDAEEQTPTNEELLNDTKEILSLNPTSITEEQITILRDTAYQTFETAEFGSVEYNEALEMLAVAAEADDPELPEELAAVPVLGAVAGQVLDVMNDLGNVGADMAPQTREQSEKVVIAAIIVGNIAMTATQAAASAAVAAARRP